MVNNTVTHALKKAYMPLFFFSLRHISAFLCLGIPDSTSALYLGAILNSKITNKKDKKYKKVGIMHTVKRTLACSMRAETKEQSISLFNLSPGHL